MKKPNILIVGKSGSGKSTSIENLDPATTVILNIEQKQLPFRKATTFKRQAMIPTLDRFNELFQGALKAKDVEIVIVESFTSLCELIMIKAKKLYTGWDVRSWYNEQVFKYVLDSKGTDKYVIFTGIDESIDDENGAKFYQLKVSGKELKGIEKEFVITLFTVPRQDEKGEIVYEFVTRGDIIRSAKSPKDMFSQRIPNDLGLVIKSIEEYYKEEVTDASEVNS